MRKYAKLPYILSVEALSKEVQLFVAKHPQVDIVSYSDVDILKTITPGVISLTKQNGSLLEFSLSPIMVKNQQIQSKNFRNLYKAIHLAINNNALFILNGNFENTYHLRHPRGLISICHSLLDLPLNLANKSFSENVRILIKRVENRSNGSKLNTGIRIISSKDK